MIADGAYQLVTSSGKERTREENTAKSPSPKELPAPKANFTKEASRLDFPPLIC
jgi:hypothetical protein